MKKRMQAVGYTLVFLAFAAGLLYWNRSLFWVYFGPGYEKTDAIVLNTNATQGLTPIASYTFVVDGQMYKGSGQIRPLEDNYFTYTVPKVMEVYYDPKNPSHNYSAYRSFACRFIWGPLLMFIVLPVLLLCAFGSFVLGVVLGKLE